LAHEAQAVATWAETPSCSILRLWLGQKPLAQQAV